MTWEIGAVVLGLGVGLSLGALGGGGSTLAVPILVFVAGMQAQDATTASLLVVGTASAIGAWRHWKRGNVRLGAGLAFGLAGIVGSRIGTQLNRSLDEDVLLVAFSILIVFVALRMYRSVGRRQGPGDELVGPSHASPGAVTTLARPRSGTRLDLSPLALATLGAAATVVGLLTGLFGVGGGFAVVPALTLLLGFGAKEAIGTSLVVIAANATVALLMRSGDLGFDWSVTLPFLATVVAGVLLGTRLAERIDADRLTRAFAVMLVAVAAYTAVSAVAT